MPIISQIHRRMGNSHLYGTRKVDYVTNNPSRGKIIKWRRLVKLHSYKTFTLSITIMRFKLDAHIYTYMCIHIYIYTCTVYIYIQSQKLLAALKLSLVYINNL